MIISCNKRGSRGIMVIMLLSIPVIISLFLMPQTAYASLSLGSVTGARTANAFPGDTVSFDMLLFNIHENSTLVVNIDIEGPDGWVVRTNPASFTLDYHPVSKCITKEYYECLSTGQGGVMARPIKIIVDIPNGISSGKFPIIVTSHVGTDGSSVNMQQSRAYQFSVFINENADNPHFPTSLPDDEKITVNEIPKQDSQIPDNSPVQVHEAIENESDAANIGNNDVTGMAISSAISVGIYIVLIALIVVVSWRLYRR